MAKSTDNTQVGGRHTVRVQLTVPKSRPLFELLRGSGAHHGDAAAEKVLNSIAATVDPGHCGAGIVTLNGTPTRAAHPSEADIARQGLAFMLRKARDEDHEAADQLADLAAQLGYTEPGAEPEPQAPTLTSEGF